MKVNSNDNAIDKPSQEEREVDQYSAEMITSLCDRKQFDYEEETTLDFYYDEYDHDDSESEEENYEIKSDTDYEVEDDATEQHHQLSNYSIEFMQKVVDYADETDASGKRRRTWKSVHHRFRTLPDQSYVSRFRNYLKQNVTRRQKTQKRDELVYKKFTEARKQYLPIHDIDIQHWAVKVAKELDLDDFQASEFWLRTFKKQHRICSRKITNIITKREILNSDDILKSEENFIKLFNKLSPKYKEAEIFNTDLVGIEKEQHSTRTLSLQSE
ncbi:unnamed protein product [Rotaria sordida]|uniref:HTH CENPB-type domain-containing protein n=1 Tax=Rotaria sordida TaxID=392033 RepID=A0A819PTP8_9BILA|nr:unnamed protein product [Rotaria sordida]CAF1203432.1 unnamed protein product [Rotaria sordida]CAF1231593.1 unnamed protein product [Rotaria sordida]CAF1250754.1 unnamed protein product [Rotaria sordida]CAF1363037.1 unnamed protein product [Rotaria sordida]